MALVSANARDVRDMGSIPGSGRSPGGGHGNPLQYACLENPMDKEAWQVTVPRVTKSQTGLKQLSTHTHTHTYIYNKKECPTDQLEQLSCERDTNESLTMIF